LCDESGEVVAGVSESAVGSRMIETKMKRGVLGEPPNEESAQKFVLGDYH